MATPTFPIDFNLVRKTFANEIQRVTGLTAIKAEITNPQLADRPNLPYFSFKLTSPAIKSGDDSKENVLDSDGNPTTIWNSGGVRKMMVQFDCYAQDQEEAYNFMCLWQTSLDLENIQADLRRAGIAVWIIGNVADLSQLLNTGYEGRAHMDCSFGIAANLQSDLGSMEHVTVDGSITTDQNKVVQTSLTVPQEE